MADELPDFPDPLADPYETNGAAISRSLTSSRSGAAARVPQEFRERQQTAREQDAAWRKDITERKFDVEKTAAQATRDAVTLRAAEVKFNLLSKLTDIRQKNEELDHSIKAMEEFNGLDYKDGTALNKIADIYRRNPRALDNPRVASFADKILGMHENYLKDFRSDAQTDISRKAALDAAAAAKVAGQVPSEVTTKVDDVTTKFTAPEGAKSAGKDFGTETVKIDDKTTIRRPLPAPGSPEARTALEAQHAKAEAELKGNWLTGKPDAKKIGALNALKAQLRYDQLDPATGQVRPKPVAVAPISEPSKTIIVPASAAPTATPAPVKTVDIHEQARAAIAAGAPRDTVLERLKQKGGDPSKL